MSRRLKQKTGLGKASPVGLSASAPSAVRTPGGASSRPPETGSRPIGWSGRWAVLGVCIFLVVIIWLVFGQTLGFGFVNYDDNAYVYDNPVVQQGLTWAGFRWALTYGAIGHWHPLTWLSHMLDCQVYGLHAGGHHLSNVLLHTATAILLFLVLRRMTGFLWRSAFVAAVFAVHPLHVESVAWIAERKDVLSAFFFMLTLGAYVGYVHHRPSMRRYGLVMLCFALGLLAKDMLVTLPFVLLLLDYWPLNRIRNSEFGIRDFSRLLVEKIPLLALTVGSCVVTFLVPEKLPGYEHLPLGLRLENAVVSYVTYLWQMIYPVGLACLYPNPTNYLPLWQVAGALALLLGLSGVIWMFHRRQPWLAVGWLWYLGMLVPVIGIVQISYYAHADRYTYLPQIGLYVLLTWAAADLCTGWRHRRVVLGGLSAIILVALIGRAHTQVSYWRNSEALWTHTLACTSNNFVGHTSFGTALLREGKADEAITQYHKALQINPDYEDAQNDLGAALIQKGKLDEAIAHLRKALQINPDDPDAYNNFGNALLHEGKVNEATVQFQKALQINPDDTETYINLGNALLQRGKVDEAIAQYEKALQINPYDSKAHNNFGTVLLQKGNVEEAIAQYQKALQINPDNAEARNNLGNVLLQMGKAEEAIVQYRRALQIKPDFVNAHNNLGNALLQMGKMDEAVAQYQKALQINPDLAKTYYNLGAAVLQKGDINQAIIHFQEALQIKPDYAEACYRLGNAFRLEGKFKEAIACYQKGLQIKPDYIEAQNNLAWVLATCPQASLRNGKQAVELAQRANQLTGDKNLVVLSTLAAAYAEAGRFPEAVKTAQHALELAKAQSIAQAETIRSQLKLYQASRPFHSN